METTDPLKTDQWQDAMELISDFEPRVTGYNELQESWGGPRPSKNGGVMWNGHSHDQQIMREAREAFIALQDRPCCEHGNAWQNSDGEMTTLEYVFFYRLCACCANVIKCDDEDGGDPRCHICSCDELLLDDISDEALSELLAAEGWEPISREDALQADRDRRMVIGNCASAIGGARRMGEGLWSNDRVARHWAEQFKQHDEQDRGRYEAEGREIPSYVNEAMERHAQLLAAGPVYVMGLSGALQDVARKRWQTLQNLPHD